MRLVVILLLATPALAQTPDLIVVADRVWTGNPAHPSAEAVAVVGMRIAAVGSRSEILALRGAATRVIDLPGRFVAPGFIDNHTHFAGAGNLLLNVNLLDVSDEAALVRRVREARDRLPQGSWLLNGQWGAYEQWRRMQLAAIRSSQPRRRSPRTGT
jgi:hypothetical protein